MRLGCRLWEAVWEAVRDRADGMMHIIDNGAALWPGLRLGRSSDVTRITLRRAS